MNAKFVTQTHGRVHQRSSSTYLYRTAVMALAGRYGTDDTFHDMFSRYVCVDDYNHLQHAMVAPY